MESATKPVASTLLKRAADQSAFDRGDVSFILICSALVLFMVPGLGFLYSGLARRKSALSLLWVVVASNAVVIFQWYFWGYSLTFSSTATNGFIGNLNHIGLRNVLNAPSPGSPLIPELLYSFYQLQFAAVTVAILMGAVAERGRVLPAMVFAFIWATIVYAPVACWAWNVNGWGFKWGVLDYAGGGPVEIGSGVGGLAYSWVLGRRAKRELINFRPHNVSLVVLGTFMLWFGWIGFNAGSAFGANLRAAVAGWNTGIAAAFSGIVWCLLDFRHNRKYTMHGVAGIIGLLFNGIFAADYIISLDEVNTAIPGGFMQRNFKQLYIQFGYVVACCAYVFVVTAVICKVMDYIPGLSLRCTDEAEIIGMDEHDIGEFVQDFVEVRRAFDAWNPPTESVEEKDAMKADIVAAGDRHGGYTDIGDGQSLSRTHSRIRTAVPSDSEKDAGAKVDVYAAGDRHGHNDLELAVPSNPQGRRSLSRGRQ
ncbi:hypothetical protein FRC00_003804 [Tulasnella sp. 408]|nr:hypothetical protein FRC00_003804 [Tulasnella sp. 408]